MKKRWNMLWAVLLLCSTTLNAQVIFYEDFDGVGGPTAGGAGTYVFAPAFSLRNVDNATPAAAVAWVNEAWERREDFKFNVADSCAFSTSWYTPAGTASDFMWTPLLGPLPSNCHLTWNAVAYDPSYPDGYSVHIMTSTQGPPTGGTGSLGNQLTSSTQIFSIAAEATIWTTHDVDLTAYTGQSVYIGFRNNSTDKFILAIDDIKVEKTLNYDAMVMNAVTPQYYLTPLMQSSADSLEADVKNGGIMALTNVNLNVKVYDPSMALVYTASGATPVTLTVGGTSHFKIPMFVPTVTGLYTVKLFPSATETEENPGNDTSTFTILYDDHLYARDNGTTSGALGIGAGNGGYLGQQFRVYTPQELGSIDIYYTGGYTGKRMGALIWNMTAGVPDSIVLRSDTLFYPDDSARQYRFPLAGGPAVLTPGDYVVTAIEFDSTLKVGLASSIFTLGTTWVNWPSNPFGTWAHNEAFGSGFAKAYTIRLNFFSCDLTASTTSTEAGCLTCTDGTATVSTSGGTPPMHILWSNGDTTAVIDSLGEGTYVVTVTDYFNCSVTDTVVVGYSTVSISENHTPVMNVSPNPSNGNVELTLDESAVVEVSSVAGHVLFRKKLSAGKQPVYFDFPNGVYLLKATHDKGVMNLRMVISR